MAEKKDVTIFTGEIFYGLTSQGLAFQDRVDVEIRAVSLPATKINARCSVKPRVQIYCACRYAV